MMSDHKAAAAGLPNFPMMSYLTTTFILEKEIINNNNKNKWQNRNIEKS